MVNQIMSTTVKSNCDSLDLTSSLFFYQSWMMTACDTSQLKSTKSMTFPKCAACSQWDDMIRLPSVSAHVWHWLWTKVCCTKPNLILCSVKSRWKSSSWLDLMTLLYLPVLHLRLSFVLFLYFLSLSHLCKLLQFWQTHLIFSRCASFLCGSISLTPSPFFFFSFCFSFFF